jgi:hypothetical protein
MNPSRLLATSCFALLLAVLLVAPQSALAAPPARGGSSVELGLGADMLLDPSAGAFELTLGGRMPLARHLSVGGRAGVLALTAPGRVGVPLDAALRGHFGRVYVEGLVGPWIVDGLRFHGAIGVGLSTAGVHAGLEVGWLDGRTMLGLRVAIPI